MNELRIRPSATSKRVAEIGQTNGTVGLSAARRLGIDWKNTIAGVQGLLAHEQMMAQAAAADSNAMEQERIHRRCGNWRMVKNWHWPQGAKRIHPSKAWSSLFNNHPK